ncbi:MAG: hypothetical protein WCL11_04230 [Verrucomicrobiota bacterium]
MKRILLPTLLTAALLSAGLFVGSAEAQVLFGSGSPYTQNFDALANTGTTAWLDNSALPGWYASTNNSSGMAQTYKASAGTDNTGMIYSYGTASTTDRALGSAASNTSGPLAYGVRLTNDTSMTITNIAIAYTGEQWRNGGNAAPQTLAFSYRTSSTSITSPDSGNANAWTAVTNLDFTTPTVGATAAALDGNAAANRHVFPAVVLAGAVVPPGWEIFLRWRDINDTGSDHGVSVDDLTVSFTGVTVDTTPPDINAGGQPHSRTNNAGTIATFTVVPSHGTGLNYQWRKDGFDLADGGKFFHTMTDTLTVSNLLATEAGSYDVVVANGYGSVTSAVATLTIIDPAVNTQPLSRTNLAGDTANFSAGLAGTPFTYYQWLFQGDEIPGATDKFLSVPNLQSINAGAYVFVVTGLQGSVTSAPAYLTLLATPAIQVARWDFNATNSLATNAPITSIGTGTATVVNGTKGLFNAGTSSDPAGTPGSGNSGWTTTTYGSSSAPNKQAGAQFNVSTLGYQDILLAWEQRHSDAASKYTRLQYSTDGSNFVDGNAFTMLATNNSFVFYTSDLSAILGVNNNANFAFRIVSEWEATAIGNNNSNYVGTVSSYDTGGTIRFDLMSVYGNPLGAPTQAPTTISNIVGTTLTYGGGAGSQYVLLKSTSIGASPGGWTRMNTNFATPGTFTVPTGSETPAFYRIKSE